MGEKAITTSAVYLTGKRRSGVQPRPVEEQEREEDVNTGNDDG